MKKNKKGRPELQEGERYENFFEVFIRNYKNAPAFKAFVKLILFFIVASLMITITYLGKSNKKENNNTTTTTTEVVEKISFKELLNNLSNYKDKITMTIKSDASTTMLEYEIKDDVIEGNIFNDEGTKKFKLIEDKIYEVTINGEIESPELFNSFDYKLLSTKEIINRVSDTIPTKKLDNKRIIYHYTVDTTHYYVVDNDGVINSIQVKQNGIEYDIIYK